MTSTAIELFQTETEELISGSEAIALACALADVDVITAYPIRPYDTVMQFVSRLKADGSFDFDFIVAESEHSQFEIVKHASSVGARTFTGSSGVGWFYAFEAITVTAGLRLPVVAMVGNRALDDPGAFGVEHNDALAVRDLGWMLYWVATAQEALDTALLAWRVAEDPDVFLPMALSCDGSFLTHSQAIVNVPTREQVDKFLPPYDRGKLQLHPDNPITIAPQVNEDWLMEMRRQSDEAMHRSVAKIKQAYEEFKEIFGRGDPSPFVEEYMTEDAEIIIVGMGTLALPVRVAVRRYQEQGRKVGFLRVKFFRPFPTEELQEILTKCKAVCVVDRDYSYGAPSFGGVLFTELRSALYPMEKRPHMLNFIAGLGGREVHVNDVNEMVDITQKAIDTGKIEKETTWIGVRD
ncbi:MAG TPA: pyruvate ferredoxin oxidoreductase [Dehalococcoidia bacterium]|nr:pyruvate ferredoxin oxidoreductase [Dehalococcoidia bacterium]MEE3005180.1 pyruvate ferredoxin oxidoreductase [Chloroflexota bacterium]MAZ64081.1 pyruvate ferredoxin oxidoreductase [Dehalococcoidia bacterium]MCS5658575.1 pyruvate ferredoxin oxidoreductase [Dehalococcoidia bacterium]MEE3142261.1 pyruvate ferredoxin oxidoreductase [Chloroflexota bacterium]|tara:strand:+ start:6223 stop:7446 length:1224 start_codon:yes stop_codon:yes gene_type:complete